MDEPGLPRPRGPLSAWVSQALLSQRGHGPAPFDAALARVSPDSDDAQLALWMLYELHYRGFVGVREEWEWDLDLLRVRAVLEQRFEAIVRDRCRALVARACAVAGSSVVERLEAIAALPLGPSLARFLQREATREQYVEFLVQRSIYHLKESDPQAWVVPRLSGRPKVALAELQYDEFGAGVPARLHSELYAEGLRSVGLRDGYAAYVEMVPGYTLAANNVMSMFGLHRRLRGASMGHLAIFEMTSAIPCRRYLQGAQRLGLPAAVQCYFDEHVEADAVHEHLASRSICAALIEDDPSLQADVLLGAAACVYFDDVAARAMIGAWRRGSSTLREVTGDAA